MTLRVWHVALGVAIVSGALWAGVILAFCQAARALQ